MNRKHIGLSIMAASGIFLLLALTFSAGYTFRAMAAERNANPQVHLPPELVASINPAPGLRTARPDLKPFEYLWEVMQAIKQHYVEPTKINENELTYGAIRGMLKALGDRYTRFMDPDEFDDFSVKNSGEFTGIGAQLEVGYIDETTKEQGLMILAPLPGSPAEKAGLKKGDFILKIDGKSTESMAINIAVHLIRGPRGTPVKLTISRKGVKTPFEVSIIRDTVELRSVEYKMLDNEIGYVHLQDFMERSSSELNTAFSTLRNKNLKGLVFDLRNDPGGLLDVAVDVASLFMKSGTVVYTKNRSGQEEALKVDPTKYLGLKVPVVVLINGGSASASEIVAGALQDTKMARLIGERSFGKASVQVLIRLQNGGALAITTAKYFTPSKRDITDKGITPDQVVPLTEEIYAKNGDIQLKQAIDYLKKEEKVVDIHKPQNKTAPAPREAARPLPTNLYNCVPWISGNA